MVITKSELKRLLNEVVLESGIRIRPNYSIPLSFDTSITSEKTYEIKKLFKYNVKKAIHLSVLSIGGGLEARWNDNPTLTTLLVGDQIEEDIETLVLKGSGAGTALLWIGTRI